MPLRYMIDENLRGTLSVALVRRATQYGLNLDVVQVGDEQGPALGIQDPELLTWGGQSGRIILSRDRRTLGVHLEKHLEAGGGCPGIILLRDQPLMRLAEHLVLIAFATEPAEWRDQIAFVP